ncbi:epimerase [Bacteroides muris (ex Afrizal et al. 2022)]|uniref:Epimerase n=1 Tax=Bacteroides muris (ex Afrizal et al. 2022) TaxID=2516960 RepID=A0A4S2B0T1_9BACE|nr:epimerase [Bacteroides muris (ex Afrizal et al. 2022)]
MNKFILLYIRFALYLPSIKSKKSMKTMFVNTYWWWHPLQLRQS